MKRLTAAVMAIILAFSLAGAAVAQPASFPDIRDPGLRRDVAVLQLLGAVSGDDNGFFNPDATLTRAAFCKIAVIVMGLRDQEPLYRNRTIFPDVRAGYWASGFINLAVSGEKKIILGNSDGLFRPDDPVTAAQAVTILMRVLGYGDADAGMLWPDGYLALAQDKGLADGFDVTSADAAVTRASAAHLFCNLLSTPVKAGGSYISTLGTATAGTVIMQLDVTATDGTGGAVRTSGGIMQTVSGVLPPAIQGLRGTLLVKNGKLLTFLPEKNTQKTVTAGSADAGWLKDATGTTYTIPSAVSAYTTTDVTTYGSAFVNIVSGMPVTLYFSADGKIDGVYISTARSGDAVVIGADGAAGALNSLTGGVSDYTVVRNGVAATFSDLRPYDVATYDAGTKILYVSDFRLTGCYESCWPSMSSPSKVTVLGHEFSVLPSAAAGLANYKVGQNVTFLFTNDLQVAGAVTDSAAASTALGIVQPGITASSASVKLTNGLILTGNPYLLTDGASKLAGELVTVYSAGPGQLGLSALPNSGARGSLDVVKKTLGGLTLSPSVKLFERVNSGPVEQILFSDITQKYISADKILYAGTDAANNVTLLIFNDVTGDRYAYGYLREETTTDSSGMFSISTRTVSLVNSANKAGTAPVFTGLAVTNNAPGGLAVSTDGTKAAGVVTLTMGPSVKRTDFYTRNSVTYLTLGGVEFPVSSKVQCYNKLSGSWFASFSDVRTFSDTMTVYYDRAAADGGKIRMIVVG